VNRRRNAIVIAAAVVVVILIGAFVARPHDAAIGVHLQTLRRSTFQTRLPETGTLQRPQTETLSAQVSGTLDHFTVAPGQHVEAGAVLAIIANPQVVNAADTAHATYLAAAARSETAAENNAVLPLQNRSSVVQAEAAVEQARFNLNQARQDVRAGTESGLGYGGTSADEQRAVADAAVANAATQARESLRIYTANEDLYANKAISRDALEQSRARNEQDEVNLKQAQSQRNETYAALARQAPVLGDRVRAAQDAVRQAEAALASARANAAEPKTGDVDAARADAAARRSDWLYAADQVARLTLRAPFAGIVETVANQPGDITRPLQPGDAVTVGQALVTMAADTGYIVRTKVDEQDIAAVSAGQHAVIGGEDLAGATLPGHVIAVDAVAQKSDDPSNTSRQVITTVRLDRTLPFLRDGMTVDVDIITHEAPHALVVGNDAIRHDANNQPYVFVVRDGRTVQTPVTLGPANETQTVVTRGLAPGDVIVDDRNIAIGPGIAVKAS
jgi:multidrug efflux pump subunit AcrA (membrane-fusion protein)